jgi:hypothetical protein
LVNIVTVTGTDSLSSSVVVTDTATLTIGTPTNLPAEEQPTQQREMWLPRVEQ